MSASLVGSEMCIRDRGRPSCHVGEGSNPYTPSTAGDGRRGRGLRTAPVSYTHLTLPTICSV
eukprot:9103803-Alexandrium_andersonii.AAC.1